MEAETYVGGGFSITHTLESVPHGIARLRDIARVWQPSRLKGIVVAARHGTPFLAATQVFDVRPTPRKWLALERTEGAKERFVPRGAILVTCSGSVGSATISHAPHQGVLISHDLLRVDVREESLRGWVYAFLRTHDARAMMLAARYGHIIKHLEVSHLDALPVPLLAPARRKSYSKAVTDIFGWRDRANQLVQEAERLFADAVGPIPTGQNPENGFSVPSSVTNGNRRRLDAAHHSTVVSSLLKALTSRSRHIDMLGSLTERIWLLGRLRRAFGPSGVPYLSAEELFSLNPTGSKRVIIEQTDTAGDFYLKAGWIVMVRSGQVYGLNGSVTLVTKRHEAMFLSDDLIRIIPKTAVVRPGYLLVALSHPSLGRPLVVRHAYGTSIPHLEPADVASIPIVRLGKKTESEIADRAEEAACLRSDADALEDRIADEAAAVVKRVLSGDTSELTELP